MMQIMMRWGVVLRRLAFLCFLGISSIMYSSRRDAGARPLLVEPATTSLPKGSSTTKLVQAQTVQAEDLPPLPTKKGHKLEFVHITKTGGTAIEKAAAQAGIAWGACHYAPGKLHCKALRTPAWRKRSVNQRLKPEYRANFYLSNPWHTPTRYYNPTMYHDAATFVIVRHPYARAVSEYYCPWGGYKGPDDVTSPQVMNAWLQEQLTKPSGFPRGNSFLPQHKFVLRDNNNDDESKLAVDYILHFETLERDFARLLTIFGLNDVVQLPERVNVGTYDKNGSPSLRLTVKDLDHVTRAMIDEYVGMDFELFGYTKDNTESWSGGIATNL